MRKSAKNNEEDLMNEVLEYIDKKCCEICHLNDNRDEEQFLCDRCDDCYHQDCLEPSQINAEGAWMCPVCVVQ